MNCSLLDDDNYQREVMAKMPVWLAEGRCYLPDHRCIWDWIKYNLRAHAVQFSKRKAKEKKMRRTYYKMNLTKQSKHSNVILPIKMQATLIRRKKEWNIFMKKNFKISSFAYGRDGVNMVKRVRNIFSIWRTGSTSRSEFRSVFDSRRERQYILWNNKEILVIISLFSIKNFLNKMSFS